MKVSKVALAAATLLGGSAMLFTTPALAQTRSIPSARSGQQQQQQQPQAQSQQGQQPQRQLTLSRAERTALTPLEAAITAQDWTAAQAALPAAQAAAQGPDARYFVARATWTIGNRTSNPQLELQAIAQLIDLPSTPAAERPLFLERQAELAFNANDFATAERAFTRLLELTPNDTRLQENLAVVRARMGNNTGALSTLLTTIQTQETAGQTVAADLYGRAVRLAYQARQQDQTLDLMRRMIRAYPTGTNWRDGIMLFREFRTDDAAVDVDAMRLMRSAGALNGRTDYLMLAQQLDQSGLPGETKAVIDEGVAAGALRSSETEVARLLGNANRRIAEDRAGLTSQIAQARSASGGRQARIVADALYGYGRYAEAAELYQLALTKGGEDTNLVNTRLGATLALAGQRAEAEAALNAVTGPRQELARFWLLWLQRRPA